MGFVGPAVGGGASGPGLAGSGSVGGSTSNHGNVNQTTGAGNGGNGGATPSLNRFNRNAIWITGEFFGVQRARDMLYKISLQKVRSWLKQNVRNSNCLLRESRPCLEMLLSYRESLIGCSQTAWMISRL